MLNVLQNATLQRCFRLTLFGFGSVGALIETIVSVPDARFPWFLVLLFTAGSFVDTLREKVVR